ncbi:MAG: GAF domain-containing protein [Chloroflexi bacterium]|nr:GAF domain-containing protein [Chloroflexota bacterium]
MNITHLDRHSFQSPVYKNDSFQAIFNALSAGRCVRVLGSRFRSKSALMLAAAQMLQEQGTHAVQIINMKHLPILREQSFLLKLSTDLLLLSEVDLFASLFGWLQRDLFPMDTPIPAESMQTAREFREGMEMLLRRLDRPLVLFIDDLNAAPPNVLLSLLNTLADLFTAVSQQSGLQFQAVIGGALNLESVGNNPSTRFLQVSDLVWVDDLDEQEQQAFGLAACRRAEVEAAPHSLETLFKHTGGDLFLIERVMQIGLKQLSRRGQTELTSPRVAEAIDTFLNNPPNPKITEILRQVEGDTNLLHCTLVMLEQGSISLNQLPMSVSAFPNSLDLCGIFKQDKQSYRIKNEIWGQLLQKHLNPARVGGFYAVNGRWRQAFKYLGHALNNGQSDVRPALFTAVLNAMHASENAPGALNNLALGLASTFPENDLLLYSWQEGNLTLFYPDSDVKNEEDHIRNPHLRIPNQPEMQAINGASYTIAPSNSEIRLLIPLRSSLHSDKPVGLVSLGKLNSLHSPYQRKDEVLQLVSFLEQATQVIEERAKYANLLQMAEVRVTTLNRLNGMLTQMLHNREWSERHILQMALTGIASPYGLNFNRAALFMLNENEQCLQVPYAVGQLTQQDSELERNLWRQQPADAALSESAVPYTDTAPLKNVLTRLRLPLHAPTPDLLLNLLQSGEAVLSSNLLPRQGLPPAFAAAIGTPKEFGLVPLSTGEQTLGVLYVDNKFSPDDITQEQFELLQTFINQVALVLENARALVVERQRTSSWRQLLQIEETLNNQVTSSVGELLQTAVGSAQKLFQADSVVVYPFLPNNRTNEYRYEPEHVTAVGTITAVFPTDNPRSSQGMAVQVLQQGYLSLPDVQAAAPPKLRLCLDTSTFLAREGVRSFIGIRLGPAVAPIGILYLNWMQPHQLTAEQKTVLEVFANYIAIALPSARSYQQVQDNLSRRNNQLKKLDQVFFGGVYFRSDEAIKNMILLTLRGTQEYTNARRVFLIRDEPKGAWGIYQLLSTGKLHSRQVDSLPKGLIKQAYTQGKSQLETNAGRPETGRFPFRLFPESRCGLAIPVKMTGQTLAILYLESPSRTGLTKEHRRFLEKLASRLAMNLEQADQNRALQELRNLSQRLADEVNLENLLAAIITQALNALQSVDAIAVYYKDPETDQTTVATISSSQDIAKTKKLSNGPAPIVQVAWQLPDRKFVNDVDKMPSLRNAFPHTNRYRSTAVFPLEVGQNRVGCMFFGYNFHHHFGETSQGMLEMFAQLTALAILRARLHTEAEQRQQQLQTVSHITPIISASVNLDQISRNIIQEILAAFPKANNACLAEHLPEKNQVAITTSTQPFYHVDLPLLEDETFRTRLDKRRGIAGRVIETGEPANVPDVINDIDYIPANPTTKSELVVPIIIDEVINYVIIVESDQKAAFTEDDQELLTTLAIHVGLAIKNASQSKRAQALELTKQTAMMATGLVHDINNAVATFPDLVDEIAYKHEQHRDISAPLNNLRKSAKVTDKISGRLKDFVFTGAYQPELIETKLLIRNSIDLSKPQKPPNVIISKEIAPQLPKVHADSLWIELLLKNLLVNAFAAIPNDREGKVTIVVDADETHIHLHVGDNGNGIARELQRDVFKFGISTKNGGVNKMQGVGLFHSHLIAQVHNGKLQLASEPGIGSVFTLSLPLQANTEHSLQEGLIDV